MLTRSIFAVLCFGGLAGSLSADEPPKYKPIDAETIAAYRKIGGGYGGFSFDRFGAAKFTDGMKAAAAGLPGFAFDAPDRLSKLPPVSVPFGLDLQYVEPPTGGLTNLEGMDNLALLDFTHAKLGDAELKHLRDLKKLTALYLYYTRGCNLSPAPVSGRKRTLGYENGHESPILPNPSVSAKARSRGDFQESTEVWHWIDPAYTFSDGCRIAATGYMESAFFFPSVHPSMSQSWELRRFSLTQAQKSWIVGAPERLHPHADYGPGPGRNQEDPKPDDHFIGRHQSHEQGNEGHRSTQESDDSSPGQHEGD